MNMKKILLFFAAMALIFCSCVKRNVENTDESVRDPEIEGEFEYFAEHGLIDMSQSNKFVESLFCNAWEGGKAVKENYVDGQIESSSDITILHFGFTLNEDHTLTYWVECEDEDFPDLPDRIDVTGTWLYSHNFLMLCYGVSAGSCFEVMDAKDNKLSLRYESYTGSTLADTYYENPTGSHQLVTVEMNAK